MAQAQINEHPRYEPDEPCSHLEGVGVGLQVILLMVPGKVLFVALILGAAGQTEPYLSWAIFMTLAVAGVGTILQALRIKRFGAGHLVIMSVHPAHVPICIMALTTGGPLADVEPYCRFFAVSDPTDAVHVTATPDHHARRFRYIADAGGSNIGTARIRIT